MLVIVSVVYLALLIVPQIRLHVGDREMLKYIPKWLAVMTLSVGLLVYRMHARSMLESIKVVSAGMLLLVIALQLALAASIQVIYDRL